VDYKIGEYDRNAIEEAARLRDADGGSVIGITVGAPDSAKGVKDGLSRDGPGLLVSDPSYKDLEPSQTRRRSSLRSSARASRSSDLITAARVERPLRPAGGRGLPSFWGSRVCFVQKLSLEGGKLLADRRVEDGVEVVESSLPALVTVLPDINTPRIPA